MGDGLLGKKYKIYFNKMKNILKLNNIAKKNKIIVELHLDYFSRPFYKRIKIRGTNGIIYWNSEENQVKSYNNKSQRWKLIKIKNNYKLTGKTINRMYV